MSDCTLSEMTCFAEGAEGRPLTLIELLRARAEEQPHVAGYVYLEDGEREETSYSYAALDARARAIAAWLRPLVSTGDRVLLLYPPGLEYLAAFFGCLYAGAVAVPAYPPKQNRSILRLQAIVADAKATVALTTAPVLARIVPLFAQNPYLESLRWATIDAAPDELADTWQEQPVSEETLAFLQYTSGSTGTPKGVMLTHGNLLHNAALVYAACEHAPGDRYLSWLPTFHDMGFMAGILQPLYGGFPVTLMSPAAFLQKPARWLRAVTRYRATTSGGPNFAYDLCVRKITDEERAALDLSSWTVAFNGAEPIQAETIRRFTEAFAPCGFRPEAFYPCYGLAEATLMVSGSRKTAPPVVEALAPSALEVNRVEEAAEGDAARELVGCGKSFLEQRIRIVDPERQTLCAPEAVGEIWVSGRSVAQGYWNRPEESAECFAAYCADTGEGPFLRTGDLGFLRGEELFVTGRLKDLIIIRGLNHYPQDIELTVQQAHRSLRPGCGAAFAVEAQGEERLVVVQEVDHRQRQGLEEIIADICQRVAEAHEVQVYAVALIKHGSLPKTSSGKVQRHAARNGFVERSLDVVAEWRANLVTADADAEESLAADDEDASLKARLVSWFAARLGVGREQIDVDEPLSRYGLDSLSALEMKHELESRLGVALPMVNFLQSYTITHLAAQADVYLANKQAAAVESAQAPAGTHEHALSHGQQALWFLQQLAPESAAYSLVSAMRVTCEVDAAALRRAFQSLVDRHRSLRSTFHATPSGPVQRVHEQMEVFFIEDDAADWDENFLEQTLAERAGHPFDLEAGALLRVNLFRRAAREHVLLINVHHIVADFWSLAVLMDELGVLYAAETDGAAAKLEPIALQYSDYVRWQAEMLSGPEGERLWSFWEGRLGGELPSLQLPTDRPRPLLQTFRGASQTVRLSDELGVRLRELSRAHGATLYMTLLAGFQALLARYANQEEVVVGSPTGGRDWAALSGVVGYFVNPVVLRSRCADGVSFAHFLGEVRQNVLDALAHHDYPFSLLVERLQPARDPGRSPLFQVMFSFQKTHLRKEQELAAFALGEAGARLELGGLTLESMSLEQRVAQFDITLMVAETGTGLSASLEYSTDLFDQTTATRLLAHYRALLEAAAADPARPLWSLPLLDAQERRQLLFDWNDTAADYDRGATVHALFSRQAALTPSAVAVVFGEEQLTYAELDERSNQLARHLRALGVGPESRVAVFVERGTWMLVALFGTLKAGAAYVPLDPSYPTERIVYMLTDSRAGVVVTQGRLPVPASDECRPHVVRLDADAALIAAHESAPLSPHATPANLAYVIYTSGSTGRPKGVQIPHRAVVNLLTTMQRRPGLTARDTLLAVTTLSFDIAALELFLPLVNGARVLLAAREVAADGARLARLLETGGATVMQATPATWRLLLESGWAGRPQLKMLCGGEALPAELAERLAGRGRGLWNVYGPTETTIWSGVYEVPEGGPVYVGRPVANTQFYLLSRRGEPVPVGVAGELHIGGDGLARGYLNRPALTAERFVPDPFSTRPGARLYRTGDLARYLPDGNIEFLGRADEQVKLRGYRIEPGEIEAALRDVAGVSQAAVTVREDEPGDRRLVAYVVVAGGPAPPPGHELRRSLLGRLPDYMVPSAFVVLERLPLTANGKLDRRALPAPDASNASGADSYVAPRTPAEELVAGIWAEVLKAERVGAHDNFFELGGHSLLATQVISRVREVFGVEVALSLIFESPTVEGLAAKIEAALAGGAAGAASGIERAPREGELPLSFAQQRLWFLHQLEPGNPSYNCPGAVRLTGPLDAAALERTLAEVVRRHEVLRTTFAARGGQPVQVIAPPAPFSLEHVDLTSLPADAREAEAQRLADEEACAPFDLSRGPLLRARLLRLDEEDHLALFTMHHIVSDGWSMGVLVREVTALYAAFSQDAESPLTELPIQYADFAAWQRQWLTGEVLEQQLDYWRGQLGVAGGPLELPTDRPRGRVQGYRGARQTFALDAELAGALRELSRREGVTLFMTLLAAFNVLLGRHGGREDVCVGVPFAGRSRRETEGLVGFFVNMLPIRTDLSGDPRFGELLRRTRELTLGAYAHQDVPFEKLVEELQPRRSHEGRPFFEVAFGLDNASMPPLELAGLTAAQLKLDDRAVRYDLTLWVEESAGGLGASWTYRADLFEGATIARLHAAYEMLLRSCAARPGARLSALEMLTEDEKQRRRLAEQELADSNLRRLLDVKRRRTRAPQS